jgi:hypothetical protein
MEWELHTKSSTALTFVLYAAPLQDRRAETTMMYLET